MPKAECAGKDRYYEKVSTCCEQNYVSVCSPCQWVVLVKNRLHLEVEGWRVIILFALASQCANGAFE